MVDITRDPRWGRVSEGSGEDVFLGCRIAEAMVRGYQGHRPEDLSSDSTILACAKHFAAYGAPEAGRDYNTVELSERTFRDIYLPTYQAAVDAGVASVMTSFNDVDAIPATANQYLLDQLLRQQWGFEGFVVTDFTSINELVPHGVAQDSMEAGQLAINAGVNMDLQGDIYHKYLRQLVESGRVSEQQVNRMCAQVLAVKFALGLFDDPYKYHNLKAAEREFYKPENLMAARRMACESMVLLENREQTLPLTVGQRVALIGPFATAQQDLLGSWYGQGDSSHVVSIMQGMKERFGEQNVRYARGCSAEGSDLRGFGEALSVARASDVVVLTVGLPGAWSGEATSLTFLTLPSIQQQLITALRQTGKPLVLLIVSGRPLDLSWEQAQCDAMLEVWYPGTEGGHAVADVLSGDFNPSGRLTMTFPASIGQVPIHYDAKQTGRPFTPGKGEQHYVSRYLNREDNRPLYPFGYGLSYTTFTYSDLKVTPAESNLREAVEVSVQVRNVGSRRGVEVVQLYVGDVVASVTRPVRQLRGFERIELDAGEQREVRFSLNGSALSFTRQDMQFGYEPGDFKVWVGGSSEATQEGTFRVLAK
ncbi:MAG: glycoside hydrolase family 3 N-terminal domain-containing protein [Alistipes sp.]|nr:glycoside hydrolase family 3 N-terminal domain-containing protein [Alistipes sp.]